MTHSEFMRRRSFSKRELDSFAAGSLIDGVPAEVEERAQPCLPIFDRIVTVAHEGNHGRIVAEQDLCLEMRNGAGCSGVDAIWHLLGFYLALRGLPGMARALGCKEINCTGHIRPHHVCLRYEVTISLVSQLKQSGVSMVIGDGLILADHEPIYSVREAQVGAFVEVKKSEEAAASSSGLGDLSPVLLAHRRG
jgi:3-hydroxyacyl-[acyl-carrier protein] dehydratase/trans-2-decenoyl-[acyl-carrier protein] isomerase